MKFNFKFDCAKVIIIVVVFFFFFFFFFFFNVRRVEW
jgi:hypothetical protein